MTATQNLEDDHVQILRLIEVMESISQLNEPDVEHLELIVRVIREFADGLHHAKEEQFLFPFMVGKGFSLQSGPVAVMLHDHEEGRNYVKAMAENIAGYKEGQKDAIKSIYFNMLGYADLLKGHIAKENNVLFRMADKVFTSAEQDSLVNEFIKVESKNETGYAKNDYLALIDKLWSQYTT